MKKIIFILLIFIVGCAQKPVIEEPIACTAEAKICPDGSTVGRVPPDCEFEECPAFEGEAVPPIIEEILEPQEKEIVVTAKRWEFVPETIEVNKGDKVKLLITSIDVTHGFDINAPFVSVNKQLPVNREVVVEFTASETGSWNFRCSVPCGSGHGGMTGVLIVK